MSDDNIPESSNNALKRPRGSSPPVESQETNGDESQISTFSIDEEISCGICLGVLESPYTVIPCLHTFDKDCLAGWWKQNDTCPLCKVRAMSGRHSFQLQSIVNHYDNKRPPRKRARGSEDAEEQDARGEIYPFGVAPPPVPAGGVYGDDMLEHEDDENDEDNEDEDEDDLDEDFHHQPGGRIVFPCPACVPGHPSGYVCPVPIPEPSDEVKQAEKEEFFDGRRDVQAPGRGHLKVPLAEGLHTLPGADLLYTNQLIEDIGRACQEHVMYAGHDMTPGHMWDHFSFRHFHLHTNQAERQRFLDLMTAQNGTPNGVVVELMTTAGHAAEEVGPYFCVNCVQVVIRDGIEAWWTAKKEAGVFPPEVANLSNCWHGRECRTQSHNIQHAQRFNHNCDPRPQRQN